MNEKVLVIVGILVVVGLGFWFISSMTGGVVSGVGEEVVVNEYFEMNGEINKTNETEVLNGSQDSGGSG